MFNEDYKQLTPDQALFIEYGVLKVYADLFGGDEESKKELERVKRRSRHFRH